MRTRLMLLAAGLAIVAASSAESYAGRWYQNRNPWHGAFYDVEVGQPLVQLVSPKAEAQKSYAWGVTNTETSRIRHQFNRRYPGMNGVGRYGFYPTPRWPGHTDQFGVYYVRGPW